MAEDNKSEEQSDRPTYDFDQGKWGYDLYPDRRMQSERSLKDKLFEGDKQMDRLKCEKTVYKCIKESKLVRLMMAALKNSGCAVDIRRHIACEPCDSSVTGGYDPVMNQIIVCQNHRSHAGLVQGILAHEMIHMFDYCNHKLDFKNIDHVACTEIRAANLTHCSFMSAWIQGDVNPFNFKAQHKDCVKTKVFHSVMAVRDVTEQEAMEAIERVFPKCYIDLEPVGRRLKSATDDMEKAYKEAYYYGYV